MAYTRRRLPHWLPEGKVLFITWHLHGSLPKCRYPAPGHPSAGQAFVWMDRYLDATREGPMWLGRPDVAHLVSRDIINGADNDRLYELLAWVVISNHVHVLIRPFIDARELMRRIKGRTARSANLLISQTGRPFWQAESYDRWMRSADEIRRVARYIENNPVTAGLAARPQNHRWSSAWVDPAAAGAKAPVAG
ncbi:MAG: transposase [Bryobacterales bacterium]|nr:transposase [Bryobacterales bacterium]MBV9400167.1 transposase [Bryobacterales bacterium]